MFEFDVPLSRRNAAARVKHSLSPPPRRLFESRSGWEGEVSVGGFQVRRIPDRQNVFLPVAYGWFIELGPNQTRVHVILTVKPLVGLFSLVLAVVAGRVLLDATATWWRTGVRPETITELGGILVFFYLGMMVTWAVEAGRVRRFILGRFRDYLDRHCTRGRRKRTPTEPRRS
jgi:hypothetical protein